MKILSVLPLLVLLSPLACGCAACDWTPVCFVLAAVIAVCLFVLLGIIRELRLLASLANLR